MRYNVADLLKSSTGRTRVVELDEPFRLEDSDVELVAPVTGRVSFTRDHAGILVQGTLQTAARLACVRCLEPVDAPVLFELAEEFVPSVYIPGGPDIAAQEDREADLEIDEHHVLDLSEVVRQAIEVALPIHVLCRGTCKGLCPQCGANLNDGACDCRPAADPRWAPLQELISDE
jgi:uncharacterized protein